MAIFCTKALFLGLFVTPLWDVPDETGHYSYARDLLEGKGIPILGQAVIESDIMSHLKGQPADAMPNWIAQHPPVYYLLAAFPLGIAGMLTDVKETLFRIPRVIAALCAGLLFIVLYRTLIIIGVDGTTATGMTVCVFSFPMFSHLAGGTNNDVPLFLFSGLATYFWARHFLRREIKDAYWCAFWLAVAASTKMTALVLLVPMVFTIILALQGSKTKKVAHSFAIAGTALLLPGMWLLRNLIHFGDPFQVAKGARALEGSNASFLEYLSLFPVIEHFVINFIGLLGWMGTGEGQMHWFQVYDGPRTAFSIALLFIAMAIALFLVRQAISSPQSMESEQTGSAWSAIAQTLRNRIPSGLLKVLFFTASFGAAAVVFALSTNHAGDFGWARLLTASLLVFSGVFAMGLLLSPLTPGHRLACCSLLVFLFFSAVLLNQVYGSYLWYGVMRATHGRYFYPVIPVLLIAAGMALKDLRVPPWVIVVLAIVLAYFELETFLTQAVPFYMGEM
jgi:hypothetical protein